MTNPNQNQLIAIGLICLTAAVGWAIYWNTSLKNVGATQATNSNTPPPENGATVASVIDGITVKLSTGQIVRYLGVRVPSVTDPVQCFGQQVVLANEQIIGKPVRLEKDPVLDRGQDGAWVRYVYFTADPTPVPPSPTPSPSGNPTPTPSSVVDQTKNLVKGLVSPSPSVSTTPEPSPTPVPTPTEIFINERILEGGFGFPLVNQQMKYGEQLLSAAKYASATGKGLWQSCQVTADKSNVLQTQAITNCVIKGKVGADGSKLYRTPNCSAYSATIVLPGSGGQYFCAEDLAKDAGFTKAPDCPAGLYTPPPATPTPSPSPTPTPTK